MAPSRSEHQPELFPLLDGDKAVGVFYFPKTALSPNDQINEIEDTISHLCILSNVLETTKIKAAAAPKFSPVVKWLARFEYQLRNEKEKLLALNQSTLNSTEQSTEPANAEKAV